MKGAAGPRWWSLSGYEGLEGWAEEVLDGLALGDLQGRSVFLKVNGSTGRPVSCAASTHPAVIEALGRALLRRGARPWVGDSCPIPGLSSEVAEACGIAPACRRVGMPFVDLDREPCECLTFEAGLVLPIPRRVLDCELRLSLPKLKTHPLFGLSLALKNLMGLLPGAVKPALHVRCDGRVDELARRLHELHARIPFQGAVVDGIVALGGRGGSEGNPVSAGLLVAGGDLLAVDRTVARMAGFSAGELPLERSAPETLRAAEHGLGDGDLSRGAKLPRFSLDGRPSRWEGRPFLARMAYRLRTNMIRPVFRRPRCTDCGACEAICPTGHASHLRRGTKAKAPCCGCTACAAVCPVAAMVLRCPFWARFLLRRRSRALPLERLGLV